MSEQCALPGTNRAAPHAAFPEPPNDLQASSGMQSLVLGGGCFWCVEAAFRELEGVSSVVSGYAGDSEACANYGAVCSGATDHAEVIQIEYDPAQISFGRLLKVFFSAAHDPTQLDRQGNDQGRQYRSTIFWASDEQKRVAEEYIQLLDQSKVFNSKIVTRLEKLEHFFPAEAYHQNYAALNPGQPYIAGVSMPKVQKVRHLFADILKE